MKTKKRFITGEGGADAALLNVSGGACVKRGHTRAKAAWTALLPALVFALVLAGCGGGGPKGLAKKTWDLAQKAEKFAEDPDSAEALKYAAEAAKLAAEVEKLSEAQQKAYEAELAALASGGGSASAPKASGKAAPASDFSYDMSEDGKGVEIQGYSGNGGKVVIPAEIEGLPVVSVVGISDQDNGYKITSVVFPPSVKRIGNLKMFYGCDNLTSVTIQGTGVVIGQWGFGNCTELSELIFPDGENVLILDPKYSYNNSFSDCKKLPLAIRAKLKDMGFQI